MRFNFWSEWPAPIKNTFLLFGFLFFASILYTLFTDALGYSNVLDWQIAGQPEEIPVRVTTVEVGPFQFVVPEVNFLISETFIGSDLHVNVITNYTFFFFLVLSLVLGITSTTYLPKLWYVVLNLIFILILAFFKFDQLHVFGLSDNTLLMVVIVSYLGLSYLFNTLRPFWNFPDRLKAFSGLTLLWGILIAFFAEVDQPFLLLAANGFLIPYIIGLVFILMISHEILHFIVIAISRPGLKTGNNLTRFSLFSLIYLVNVTILLLYDTHVIDWNFYYLNPYVMLSFSSILGLWGLQTRKELFKSIRQFHILVLLYLVMGIFCFGSIFYFLGNSNDPILQVIKDAIIYSHFGFGAVFFIYIISNFMGMLRNNLDLEKVIYKPKNMPHFTFRFAGLMVVIGFALKENIQVPLYHSLSGMFNNVGDYYKVTNDPDLSESFYENGKLYGYRNHKSNYSLGKIYELKNDLPEAVENYSNATLVRPSEMSFVNLSRLWLTSGDIFNSHFILSDGQNEFPKSAAILNNKGVLFNKLQLPDSALIYFDAAYRSGTKKNTPAVNYIGVLAKHGVQTNPDSILNHYNGSKSYPATTNALALKTRNNIYTQVNNIFRFDSILSVYSASYAINFVTNQYKYVDSTLLNNIEYTAANQSSRYSEKIKYAVALTNYRIGFVNKSIEALQQLAITSLKGPGPYHFALGLIMIELQDMDQAAFYLESAQFDNYPDSGIPLNLARLETDEFDKAIAYWEKLSLIDSIGTDVAKSILKILNTSAIGAEKLSDDERILYIRWKIKELGSEKVKEYFKSISDPDKRFQAGNYLVKHYQRKDQGVLADYFKNILVDTPPVVKYLSEQKGLKMHIWLREGKYDSIENALGNTWIPTDQYLYFRGQMEYEIGNSDSFNYFESIKNMNAFNEEATIRSALFFKETDQFMEPYNILVEASRLNPSSVPLLKAYIREAIDQELTRYSLEGLKSLHQLITIEEYKLFVSENRVKLDKIFPDNGDSPSFD